MTKLTLDIIIKHLGQPESQLGNEYIWQCPICNDTGKDNLKFNEEKGILWCFANPEHSRKILSDIFKNNKNLIVINKNADCNQEKLQKAISKPKQAEFNCYLQDCNKSLINFPLYLYSLKQHRGITKETVKFVKMGVDTYKCRWVIPTFLYTVKNETNIIGFEYRHIKFSKKEISREKGMPSCLAMINNYTDKTEVLAIVEGYFDGYALWQHLNENGQAQYYHIVTPSNGVNSLLKFMPDIDFSRYKKFYLYIDNDEAGNNMAGKILEQYPMFERIVTKCGCKDFNEHYMKCLKATG